MIHLTGQVEGGPCLPVDWGLYYAAHLSWPNIPSYQQSLPTYSEVKAGYKVLLVQAHKGHTLLCRAGGGP